MTMLLADANDMIAKNRKSVATLQRIRDRMAEKGEEINISAHEAIVDGQQDEGMFGAFMYYEGARQDEFWGQIRQFRKVWKRRLSTVMPLATQRFDDACEKIINRHFPKKGTAQ